MTKLIKPYYEHVGFTEGGNDAHLTIYSRTDALNWACRLEIAECVGNATKAYGDLVANSNTLVIL